MKNFNLEKLESLEKTYKQHEHLLEVETGHILDLELRQSFPSIAQELRRLWEIEDDLDEFMLRVAAGAIEEEWEPIHHITS